MLHAAPTSETKTEAAQSKIQLAPLPKRELHSHAPGAAGLYSLNGVSNAMSGRSPEAQRRQMLAGMQRTYGNQAVLRTIQSSPQVARMAALRPSQEVMLQRKCAEYQAAPSTVGSVPPIVHDVLIPTCNSRY